MGGCKDNSRHAAADLAARQGTPPLFFDRAALFERLHLGSTGCREREGSEQGLPITQREVHSRGTAASTDLEPAVH